MLFVASDAGAASALDVFYSFLVANGASRDARFGEAPHAHAREHQHAMLTHNGIRETHRALVKTMSA